MTNNDDLPELQWQPDLEELEKHKLIPGNIDHLWNMRVIISELEEKLQNGEALTGEDIQSLECEVRRLTQSAN